MSKSMKWQLAMSVAPWKSGSFNLHPTACTTSTCYISTTTTTWHAYNLQEEVLGETHEHVPKLFVIYPPHSHHRDSVAATHMQRTKHIPHRVILCPLGAHTPN